RFVLGLLDADQGSVTQFVNAGLDGEHSGKRDVDKLKVAGFELAFDLDSSVVFFDLHDDGGMRPAEQFGEYDAGLGVTVIVGLEAGKNEVELLIFDGCRKSAGEVEGVEADESIILEVNCPICAFGEGFPQNLLGARRAGSGNDYFAAMFFLLAQSLLEAIGIRLVYLVGNVLANPGAGLVELEGGVFLRHLLHADKNFQADLQEANC